MIIENSFKKNISRLILTAFFYILHSYSLYAGENDFIVKQKRFINELFTKGRYFDCIAETRRLAGSDIPAEEKNNLNYFIESNYFLGGQYRTVISDIDKKQISGDDFPYLILQSQSYLKLNNNNSASDAFKNIKYNQIDEKYRVDLLLRKIEIMLDGSRYTEIIAEIDSAEMYSVKPPAEMKTGITKYKDIETKNRWLSVALSSAMPGAGQVYSGRYTDGIISFLSIAGATYGAYYFHNSGDRPLSITSGFFAALFYCGNIYGAYNSAEKAGIDSDRKFRMEFQRKYIPDYSPIIYFDFTVNFK